MDMSIPWLNPPTTFQIPGNPATDEYLLPVSGGADSAALAMLLHEIAPHINHYVEKKRQYLRVSE